MAVLASLAGFCHLIHGFTNRELVAQARAQLHGPYTPRQATYDIRRLRREGLIERIAHTHRYRVTAVGRRIAVLFTKAYQSVLTPALAALDPRLPNEIRRHSPLATAWRKLDRALDSFFETALVGARI